MTPSSVGLLLVIAFVFWRLFKVVGKEDQNAALPMVVPMHDAAVSLKQAKSEKDLTDQEIILLAKMLFFKISSFFAGGDVKALKELLSADVFDTFKKQIEQWQGKKHALEFMLIGFSSVKIIKRDQKKGCFWIEFITEQVNVLKNEAGAVIEGDPTRVQSVKDIWAFQSSSKGNFVITATKSEACDANA